MKGDYADLSTDWCWAAWQAALSAQPSPGGQGDAITPAMVDAACGVLYANFSSSRKDYRDSCRADASDALKAALAARQPAHGSGTLVDSGALQMALNVLRRAGKDEVADALESTAARQPEVK